MAAPPTATFEDLPAEVAPPMQRAPTTSRPSAPAPPAPPAPPATRARPAPIPAARPAPAEAAPRASKPSTGTRGGLGYVSGLFGIGPGLGSVGPGGSYFVTVDVWPWRYFGLGIEGLRARTSEIGILTGVEKRSFDAVRGRLSLRVPLKETRRVTYGAVSFALGPAAVGGEHPEYDTTDDEDCVFCAPRQVSRATSSKLSAGLGVAALTRLGAFELGGALRGDFAGDADIVTLSLLLGFEL